MWNIFKVKFIKTCFSLLDIFICFVKPGSLFMLISSSLRSSGFTDRRNSLMAVNSTFPCQFSSLILFTFHSTFTSVTTTFHLSDTLLYLLAILFFWLFICKSHGFINLTQGGNKDICLYVLLSHLCLNWIRRVVINHRCTLKKYYDCSLIIMHIFYSYSDLWTEELAVKFACYANYIQLI